MEAWGPGPFDNRHAREWLGDIVAAPGALEDVFDGVDSAALFLEAPICAAALAAAEVVAALVGRPAQGLPEEVQVLLQRLGSPPSLMVAKARVAAIRIARDSGLRDLWRQREEFAKWHASVRDLAWRLGDRT